MIRSEWQADAEIAPLVGADLAVVHREIARRDIEEAKRNLARFGGETWEARLADAKARFECAERRLGSVH